MIISPLLIDEACDDVMFNLPFKFGVGPPAATPYCRTVAAGIALLPTEFPARHDTHSPPFDVPHRCANVCGTISPPSLMIGDSAVTILLSSRNVGMLVQELA